MWTIRLEKYYFEKSSFDRNLSIVFPELQQNCIALNYKVAEFFITWTNCAIKKYSGQQI